MKDIKLTNPVLITEVQHYAKTHRLDIDEAIEKILKLYLRGMKND